MFFIPPCDGDAPGVTVGETVDLTDVVTIADCGADETVVTGVGVCVEITWACIIVVCRVGAPVGTGEAGTGVF